MAGRGAHKATGDVDPGAKAVPRGSFMQWIEALFRQIGLRDALVSIVFCRRQIVRVEHAFATTYPLEEEMAPGPGARRPPAYDGATGKPAGAQCLAPKQINDAIRHRADMWIARFGRGWIDHATLELRVDAFGITRASHSAGFTRDESDDLDGVLSGRPRRGTGAATQAGWTCRRVGPRRRLRRCTRRGKRAR